MIISNQALKIREFTVLDESADRVTLELWQERDESGHPVQEVLLLPTGLHVMKIPGELGRYEIVSTGEILRTNDPHAPLFA